MAFKPTKQMKIAYDFIIQCRMDKVVFGKNKEHKLTYTEYEEPNTKIIRYYHYDTFIGEIYYYKNIDVYYVRIGMNGYSDTDRNNFNSLLACEGLYSIVKCHRHDESLYLSDNNEPKERYSTFYIKGCDVND